MNHPFISLIGAGNLGSALIRGLVHNGYPADHITVTNRDLRKAERLQHDLGVVVANTNNDASETAEILILAVKPHFMQTVCQEIAPSVQEKRPLIISLAGVIDIKSMSEWFAVPDLSIVRVMTNTPMEFGKGISALFANPCVTQPQREYCNNLFKAVGHSFWINQEALLDPLTAAIGSAPAYVFLFMEALQEAAVSRGIPREIAAQVALEVFSGAAELVRQSGRSFAELRAGVTTPNGVTEHSLKKLAVEEFFTTFKAVYQAADERIEEIKEQN